MNTFVYTEKGYEYDVTVSGEQTRLDVMKPDVGDFIWLPGYQYPLQTINRVDGDYWYTRGLFPAAKENTMSGGTWALIVTSCVQRVAPEAVTICRYAVEQWCPLPNGRTDYRLIELCETQEQARQKAKEFLTGELERVKKRIAENRLVSAKWELLDLEDMRIGIREIYHLNPKVCIAEDEKVKSG